MIKVRFNLSPGENFMKWKIEMADGVISYHPKTVRLVMFNCVLKNRKSTALKIFNGSSKSVCSWIICENIEITADGVTRRHRETERLHYNPRIEPNWVYRGTNADNLRFDKIVSFDNKIYAK